MIARYSEDKLKEIDSNKILTTEEKDMLKNLLEEQTELELLLHQSKLEMVNSVHDRKHDERHSNEEITSKLKSVQAKQKVYMKNSERLKEIHKIIEYKLHEAYEL